MKINNKKGAEKIISVYWFAILIIVAGGIAYMVYSFYGSPYDVRQIESDILANKVAECISEEGQLKNIDENYRNDFLKICSLNFETRDDEIQFYLEVIFLDFNSGQEIEPPIIQGNINLKNNLGASLYHSSKSLYVLKGEQEIIVKINSVINKEKLNVKQ